MNYYYLYLIKFEDGRFYIGSRKSKVPAGEDINYWGSPGKTIKHLWEMRKEKHILFESSDISIQDLREKEYKMIQKGWEKFGKDKCINKNAGGLNHLDVEVIKNAAKRCVDEKIGIHGWDFEKRSEEAKKTWYSDKNNRGFMSWDDERIKKFREEQRKKKCKTYEFFDPNGNKVVIDDLPTFCRKNNLCHSSMSSVSNGKYIQHKGWSIVGPEKVKELLGRSWESRYRDRIFYDPFGKKVTINCYSTFARKNNLNSACLRLVYIGELLQHKGYSILHPDEVSRKKKELKLQQSKRQSRTIRLRNPEGKIVEISNLSEYCKTHCLNPGNMHNVVSGRTKSCKGWTRV
jgi:hypothetical protein